MIALGEPNIPSGTMALNPMGYHKNISPLIWGIRCVWVCNHDFSIIQEQWSHLWFLAFLSRCFGCIGPPPAQKFDVVELFAGKAWVSRCMKQCGQSVASFDIDFGEPLPGKQNAMDLLSDAGFALLWLSFKAYMLYEVCCISVHD